MQDYILGLSALVTFGLLSGLLSTFAYLPYIADTARKRTQPQRASWLIWSVLGSIAFFSQVYEGASDSLWFAGVQVSGTITVFLMSIFVGSGTYLNRSDYGVLALAAAGLVLWYFTENAAYALAITISISLLGGIVTVTKAYRDPGSETMSTWALSFVASTCAIIAVGRFDPVLLAYPVYLFVLNGAIVVAMLLGRVRDRRASDTPRVVPYEPSLQSYGGSGPVNPGTAPMRRPARPNAVFHMPSIRARAGARLRG